MPNLFPTIEMEINPVSAGNNLLPFGKGWKFDFAAGEFVLTPTGKVMETKDDEAWLEWCRKTVRTGRYRYLAYSRNYGQEFESLIGRDLTPQAKESELKRMAIECLMDDPRTARVDNFNFQWDNNTVMFSCEIANIRGSSGTVNGSVVNS